MTHVIRVKENKKIATKDKAGKPNGFVLPILNVHEEFLAAEQWPKQVYLTVCTPKSVKGPHLHMKRWGLFTCVRGDIVIVTRSSNGEYTQHRTGEANAFATIQVPAGTPAALVNVGDVDAYLLNMPSPAWHAQDQDDHPVTFDDFDFAALIAAG